MVARAGHTVCRTARDGWPADSVDFEREEFDALALDTDGRAVLAMAAKARVTGNDGLEKLVTSWLHLVGHPDADHATNAGRKLTELIRLTDAGPVLVRLVADGARWALWAARVDGTLSLSPARSVDRPVVLDEHQEEPMLETHPHDPSRHRAGTAAHNGPAPGTAGSRAHNRRWSPSGTPRANGSPGCQRAVDELTARDGIGTGLQRGEE